jgi:hypothetical protein
MNAQSQKKKKKITKEKIILDFEDREEKDFWDLWRSGRKSKVSRIMVSGFSRLKIGEG